MSLQKPALQRGCTCEAGPKPAVEKRSNSAPPDDRKASRRCSQTQPLIRAASACCTDDPQAEHRAGRPSWQRKLCKEPTSISFRKIPLPQYRWRKWENLAKWLDMQKKRRHSHKNLNTTFCKWRKIYQEKSALPAVERPVNEDSLGPRESFSLVNTLPIL